MTQQTRCVMYKTDTPSDDLQYLLDKWPNRATHSYKGDIIYLFASRPEPSDNHLDYQELSIEELQAKLDAPTHPTECIYITNAQGNIIYAANRTETNEL